MSDRTHRPLRPSLRPPMVAMDAAARCVPTRASADWLRLSASAMSAELRAGHLSSRALVAAHIARIRVLNPCLNALVKARFEAALREAEAADRRLAEKSAEAHEWLLGVPFTCKECFAVAGMPNASGLYARRDVVSQHDAPTVQRLRAAGAIVLGVSNVSELCMWMETSNRLYGRTQNPRELGRIVGGSSGGEAALVAAGASPFGLGSDVGGSIRMPAFFNGIFGHKPSAGWVPNQGQYPCAANGAQRTLTTGPLTRHAEDLWPLLCTLAARPRVPLPEPDWSRLQVLDVRDNGVNPVEAALLYAQRAAADALRRRGAVVREALLPELAQSFPMWSSQLYAAGGASFGTLLGNGGRFSVARELGAWALRRSHHTFPALALAFLEDLRELAPSGVAPALARCRRFEAALREELGSHGVMLFPSYPTAAPRHLLPMFAPFAWLYTAIINALGFPATQVPIGLASDGRPLGVQIVGAPGNDALCIGVARELERSFGGWSAPPLLLDEAPRSDG